MFPSECRICEGFLTNISRLPVCGDCIDAIQPSEGILCAVCGERLSYRQSLLASSSSSEALPRPIPRPEADIDALCGMCRNQSPPYAAASAYGSYEGGLREMIHLLKYDKVEPAARVLGAKLAEVITGMQHHMKGESLFEDPPMLVVPVPLHSGKMRKRGFNQAEMIAQAALKRMPGERFELHTGLLMRRRMTESQIGLTQNQRKENLRGAFVVITANVVADRPVLLIDDVFTTGTTASECARVLRRAGASKVWVATVARTLKRSAQKIDSVETSAAMAG